MEILDICRICLSSCPNRDIGDLKPYKSDIKSSFELFAFCVNIEVTENSNITTKLCSKCYVKIIEYYSFKSLAMKNNSYLQSLKLSCEDNLESQEESTSSIIKRTKERSIKSNEIDFVDTMNTDYIKTETDHDVFDNDGSDSQNENDVLSDDFVDVLDTSDKDNTMLMSEDLQIHLMSDNASDDINMLLSHRKRPRKEDFPMLKKSRQCCNSQTETNMKIELPSSPSCKATEGPQNYFFQYMDDSILDLIVDKSNLTLRKNDKSIGLSKEELKAFIGITLLMECIGYPQIRMYWSTKYAVPVIVQSMSRERYKSIRTSLKYATEYEITPEFKENDNLWQVRPLLDIIQKQDENLFKEIIPLANENLMKRSWPILLLSHVIQLVINKAWIKYTEEETTQGKQKTNQISTFKLTIAEKILEDYLYPKNCIQICKEDMISGDSKKGRPSITPMPSRALRKYGSIHMPEAGCTQHRCRKEKCNSKTTVRCSACNIYLCFTKYRNCFKSFHK